MLAKTVLTLIVVLFVLVGALLLYGLGRTAALQQAALNAGHGTLRRDMYWTALSAGLLLLLFVVAK